MKYSKLLSAAMFLILAFACCLRATVIVVQSSGAKGAVAAGGGFNAGTDSSVVEWADSTAGGNSSATWVATVGQNFTSGANPPTLTANVKNGNAVYVFNGVNQQMTNAASFGSTSQPYWVFCVYSYVSSASGIAWNDNSGAVPALKVLSGALKASGGGTSQTVQATADTSWHVLGIYFNGASSGYRLDGGSFTAFGATPGSSAISRVVLASVPGGGSFAQIDWAIFGVCTATSSTTLSSGATVDSVFTKLNSAWAVF